MTGYDEFEQAAYVGSSRLPWLGRGFFVVIPASSPGLPGVPGEAGRLRASAAA